MYIISIELGKTSIALPRHPPKPPSAPVKLPVISCYSHSIVSMASGHHLFCSLCVLYIYYITPKQNYTFHISLFLRSHCASPSIFSFNIILFLPSNIFSEAKLFNKNAILIKSEKNKTMGKT